jgi:hypothetical protein
MYISNIYGLRVQAFDRLENLVKNAIAEEAHQDCDLHLEITDDDNGEMVFGDNVSMLMDWLEEYAPDVRASIRTPEEELVSLKKGILKTGCNVDFCVVGDRRPIDFAKDRFFAAGGPPRAIDDSTIYTIVFRLPATQYDRRQYIVYSPTKIDAIPKEWLEWNAKAKETVVKSSIPHVKMSLFEYATVSQNGPLEMWVD